MTKVLITLSLERQQYDINLSKSFVLNELSYVFTLQRTDDKKSSCSKVVQVQHFVQDISKIIYTFVHKMVQLKDQVMN